MTAPSGIGSMRALAKTSPEAGLELVDRQVAESGFSERAQRTACSGSS